MLAELEPELRERMPRVELQLLRRGAQLFEEDVELGSFRRRGWIHPERQLTAFLIRERGHIQEPVLQCLQLGRIQFTVGPGHVDERRRGGEARITQQVRRLGSARFSLQHRALLSTARR
jgi:hypothetical protein